MGIALFFSGLYYLVVLAALAFALTMLYRMTHAQEATARHMLEIARCIKEQTHIQTNKPSDKTPPASLHIQRKKKESYIRSPKKVQPSRSESTHPKAKTESPESIE